MIRRLKIISIVLTFMVALSGWTLAHDKDKKDRDRHHQSGSLDARQYGYDQGYPNGFNHGREDRERRAGYDYQDEDYKRGERGYEKWMGSRGQYKKGYQGGYRAGYDDAYYGRTERIGDIFSRRNDRDRERNDRIDDIFNRRSGYSNIASDTGYRDGVDAGQSDLKKNKRFNPADHDRYRDGDRGYRSSYGDKETYKRDYREGFLKGYQDAYERRR